LLWHEQVDGHASDIQDSLARPQEPGTLHHRLKSLAQHAWLKTGHLNGVDGIAGWIEDSQHQLKIVTIMINHSPLDRQAADAFIDALLAELATKNPHQ
jgi:D-alanyl-D-alanine carboxypeptidase